MAFTVPDGTIIQVSSTFASAITTTAVTNANPAVATAAAHGLSNGDELLVLSGWEDLNETIERAASVATNTFAIEGFNSTDTSFFPASTGVGSVQKISNWQTIQQVATMGSSGGDPAYAQADPLSSKRAKNIFTRFNPTTLNLTLYDDPNLASQQLLDTLTRSQTKVAFKFVFPGGSKNYGYGTLALNRMPNLNKGQVNTVNLAISLLNDLTRYAS